MLNSWVAFQGITIQTREFQEKLLRMNGFRNGHHGVQGTLLPTVQGLFTLMGVMEIIIVLGSYIDQNSCPHHYQTL